jgi:hypothetical protein
MGMSLVEPEVVLLVDQVSMLMSSALSPSELKVSSHTPRPLPLKPAGGLEKCEIDGRWALGFRLGSRLCDLAKVDFEACDSGDCILMSPP